MTTVTRKALNIFILRPMTGNVFAGASSHRAEIHRMPSRIAQKRAGSMQDVFSEQEAGEAGHGI
jgi:hypothetical protein